MKYEISFMLSNSTQAILTWNENLLFVRFVSMPLADKFLYVLVKQKNILTHWGWDKMAKIFPDSIFKFIFLNENCYVFMGQTYKPSN